MNVLVLGGTGVISRAIGVALRIRLSHFASITFFFIVAHDTIFHTKHLMPLCRMSRMKRFCHAGFSLKNKYFKGKFVKI